MSLEDIDILFGAVDESRRREDVEKIVGKGYGLDEDDKATSVRLEDVGGERK